MKLNIDIKQSLWTPVQVKVGDKVLINTAHITMEVIDVNSDRIILVRNDEKYTLKPKAGGGFILSNSDDDIGDILHSGQVLVVPDEFSTPVLRYGMYPTLLGYQFFYRSRRHEEFVTPEGGYKPEIADIITGELYITDTSAKDGLRLIEKEHCTRVQSVIPAIADAVPDYPVQQQVTFVSGYGVFTVSEHNTKPQANIDGYVFIPKFVYMKV
jgi:hypothetical protein